MEYLQPLIQSFLDNANPVKVPWLRNYMKGKFDFLGLETKQRRILQRNFFKEYSYPSSDSLFDVVFFLWNLPQREFQYLAIELLRKREKQLCEADIEKIERLIVEKSWWDSVDGLAVWTCGAYFQLYPHKIEPTTTKWMQSGNFWLQRSCLLFQLKYKSETNTDLLDSFIRELYQEKEFFIRKAIGWILREYSKTNADWVRAYIKQQPLSALSYKEASKYL